MAKPIRMSNAKVAVLEELTRRAADAHWGYDLMRRTNLRSGTLYPILAQLEQARWIKGQWELDKRVHGGPPRRAYRLTAEGRKQAPLAIAEFEARQVRRRALRPRTGTT